MNFVFDTNIILLYLKSKSFKDAINLNYAPFDKRNNPIISIVTVGEIQSISQRNKWGKNRIEAFETFLDRFIVVDIRFKEIIFAYADIDTFSQGKHQFKFLNNSARNMGKNDLWIAATTFLTNSKLITTDKDFEHLQNIYFEVLFINPKSEKIK